MRAMERAVAKHNPAAKVGACAYVIPVAGNPVAIGPVAGHPNISGAGAGRNISCRCAKVHANSGRLGGCWRHGHSVCCQCRSQHLLLHAAHHASIPGGPLCSSRPGVLSDFPVMSCSNTGRGEGCAQLFCRLRVCGASAAQFWMATKAIGAERRGSMAEHEYQRLEHRLEKAAAAAAPEKTCPARHTAAI